MIPYIPLIFPHKNRKQIIYMNDIDNISSTLEQKYKTNLVQKINYSHTDDPYSMTKHINEVFLSTLDENNLNILTAVKNPETNEESNVIQFQIGDILCLGQFSFCQVVNRFGSKNQIEVSLNTEYLEAKSITKIFRSNFEQHRNIEINKHCRIIEIYGDITHENSDFFEEDGYKKSFVPVMLSYAKDRTEAELTIINKMKGNIDGENHECDLIILTKREDALNTADNHFEVIGNGYDLDEEYVSKKIISDLENMYYAII